jgi:meiotically up-regulated gene 157 (Mug157) protein
MKSQPFSTHYFYEQLTTYSEKMSSWPELKRCFERCFPNTLETTITCDDAGTFVITGDIPAMWLRDSSAQVRPYIRFAQDNESIRHLLAGVIRRQAHYLCIDPYANAFNQFANGQGWQEDRTLMRPEIWERKYELDSLCYPVQLLHDYFTTTADPGIFDESIHRMLQIIVQTMRTEQRHDEQSMYRFERKNAYAPSDTLPFEGRGTPTKYTGLVWSGFRPSDDSCKFGYLIPSNMFASVVLEYVAQYARQFYHNENLAVEATYLQNDIRSGIETYGVIQHPVYGRMYAYETDGYGHYNLMDDANVPNLLSIPYLNYRPTDDRVYQQTRRFVLSSDNPYFFSGTFAQGIGSPHTVARYIWPLGLIMQGLTTSDRNEQRQLLESLLSTTGGTELMHESFNVDNPEQFSRPWFAWANSLFGEFALQWIESGREMPS